MTVAVLAALATLATAVVTQLPGARAETIEGAGLGPVGSVTPAPAVPVSAGRFLDGTPKGRAMYGRPRSGLAWHSGFWTGGTMSTAHLAAAQAWVGHPFDFVTTYPSYGTWSELSNSDWAVGLFDGFGGRLSYGLPMLPTNRRGQWGDIVSGAHDATFATIAKQLVAHGRGDSAIRVGLEANGRWFPWSATTASAERFKAAFRRIVTVMRAQAPRLTFWFDTSAGYGVPGQTDRLDALTLLYPGDGYVDGVSMDHYDFYQLSATTAPRWASALRPNSGAGLADAVAFARQHRKGFAVPEWGAHGTQGPGDNPFFVQQMYDFFVANRDVLVYECYFNEPDPYIRNAIWGPVQLPKASATYRRLF